MKKEKFHITSITGNPANVASFFCDQSIPWKFRLIMFLVGCLTWGSVILAIMEKS